MPSDLWSLLYKNTPDSIAKAKKQLREENPYPNESKEINFPIIDLIGIARSDVKIYYLNLRGAYHDDEITLLLLLAGTDVTLCNNEDGLAAAPPNTLCPNWHNTGRYHQKFYKNPLSLVSYHRALERIKTIHTDRLGLLVFQEQQKKIPGCLIIKLKEYLLPPDAWKNFENRKKLALCKKIYTALREGQSGIFKTSWQSDNNRYYSSDERITNLYTFQWQCPTKNPTRRTPKALALMDEYSSYINPSSSIPLELFLKIYQESFEKSGLLFKRSNLLGGSSFHRSRSLNKSITEKLKNKNLNALTPDQIFAHAKKFTFWGCRNRTFKILKALDVIDNEGNKKREIGFDLS